jgi:hypothetical protein
VPIVGASGERVVVGPVISDSNLDILGSRGCFAEEIFCEIEEVIENWVVRLGGVSVGDASDGCPGRITF